MKKKQQQDLSTKFKVLEGPIYVIRGALPELTIVQVPRGAVSAVDGSFLTFVGPGRSGGPGKAISAGPGMFFQSEAFAVEKYMEILSTAEVELIRQNEAINRLRRQPLVVVHADG